MKKGKAKKGLIIFLVIIFLFSVYYFSVVLPVVKTYSKAETLAITEKTVNLAVSNVINRTLSYDSLIDINYDNKGEIVSFSANQYEINTITREIVKETQMQMSNLSPDVLKLNIGTFSGVPFLLGKGPEISLNIMPIGAVYSNFTSEFTSVGINMTKHSLFINVDVRLSVVMPIAPFEVMSSNQVLLAESIIVGKVPQVYLDGAGLNKTLNLVP